MTTIDGDGFEDFANKIKKVNLPESRKNLKPVDQSLSFEEHLMQAVAEGIRMLALEEKIEKLQPKSNPIAKTDSPSKLEDKLGEINKNAYVRAQVEVLKKMSPEARAVIEKMENGKLTKDHRYDIFCRAVTKLGDDFSK